MSRVAQRLFQRREKTSELISYRFPMLVTDMVIYRNRNSYYVCPRCMITLEREFSAYCDRCGQCLSWKRYRQVNHFYMQGSTARGGE